MAKREQDGRVPKALGNGLSRCSDVWLFLCSSEPESGTLDEKARAVNESRAMTSC